MQSLEREGQESDAGHLALCGTDPNLCSILQYPNVSDPFNVVLIIYTLIEVQFSLDHL